MTETVLAALRQLALFGAILTPLEILWPARRGPRAGRWTDLTYALLAPLLVTAGAAVALPAVGALVPTTGLGAALPLPLQVALVFLLAEIGGYWLHRLSHEIGWLWRLHAVHHTAEGLDWLATHRQHPVESVLMLLVANLPALAIGLDPRAVLGFVLAQKLYTAFLHANVAVSYGRGNRWVVSPQLHHRHHEKTPHPGNFAHTLSFLDRLWGTYRDPGGFPADIGLDETAPPGFLAQLAWPFVPRRRGVRDPSPQIIDPALGGSHG